MNEETTLRGTGVLTERPRPLQSLIIRILDGPLRSGESRCLKPDEDTEDAKLIAQTGEEHEQAVLSELKSSTGQAAALRNAQ